MDIRELGKLDLNLLVALEALLEERSVSRAAERLYVTQSAMSKTLGRLRELFDDPLFVRRSSQMVPTPRAEQLARHLPQVLKAVQAMLEPPGFDPLTWEGEFKLLVQGQMGVWLVPRLVNRLMQTAPNIRLVTVSGMDDPFEQMANGTLDYALQPELQRYPPNLCLTSLGFAPPVMLARRGHPLEGTEPDWDELLSYPHVQLIIPEIDDIQFQADEGSVFMRLKSELKPNLYTDQLYTAIQVVLATDHVFPAPPLFMEQEDLSERLVALPLPGGESVTLKYVMIHHEWLEDSAPHRFLKGEITAVVEAFREHYALPSLAQMRVARKLAY